MSLASGSRIGPYEVVTLLGQGGMGEVYRARDTELDRDVAIKVLPEPFVADPDRVARFEREAKTLAALNHPNIAHIYGLARAGPDGQAGRGGSPPVIVMEFVPGEALSERIKRGPIPVGDALAIARQICDALEAAHGQGIIHRDLKPANINVTDEGTVKVLDFGLAKALDQAWSAGSKSDPAFGLSAAHDVTNSPTLSSPAMMTGVGVLLGTAAYMSPEQAKGQAADKRSDIWAFGCVLFEMLTGTRAFKGDDVSDVLASVLKADPDWSAIPRDVPAALVRLLRRTMEKDRRRRLADISDARLDLDDAASAPPSSVDAASQSTARTSLPWRIVTLLLALALLAVGWLAYSRAPSVPAVTRFFVLPPKDGTFVIGNVAATAGVISPDGRKLAFTARDKDGKTFLWVRPIDSLTGQPLPGTDDARFPFWSPDSRQIAYMTPGRLMRIAVGGGPPQIVCALSAIGIVGRGAAWGEDGQILFNNGPNVLFRVPATGGTATRVAKAVPKQVGQEFPAFLPDGHHVLYYGSGGPDTSGVYILTLDTGESKRILPADSGAIYDRRTGRLLFARGGTLLSQPFDVRALRTTGDATPVAEGVETVAPPGITAFSVSNTGTLAYGVGTRTSGDLQLVWLDREGHPRGTVGPVAAYRGLDLSADGRVAVHRHQGDGGDIWISDASGAMSRVTIDPAGDDAFPVWSPDGSKIAYQAFRNGKWSIFARAANLSGGEERLMESADAIGPTSWAPDGTIIVARSEHVGDIWMIPGTGDRQPVPIVATAATELYGQVSPDGKWLAYMSTETGAAQIFVQSFPRGADKRMISVETGAYPRWRRDGRELYFMDTNTGGKLEVVSIAVNGDVFTASAPKPLFDPQFVLLPHGNAPYFPYAPSADGQRFLFSRFPEKVGTDGTPIVVVLNWAAGLK